MSESKDEDLLKIQVVSEHCHTIFTTKSSVIVGALIGFLVLFYTLLYSGTFSPLTFWLCFFGLSGVCLYYIRKISKEHNRNLTKISDMIEKVKKGEELPTLKELVTSDKDEKDLEIEEPATKRRLNDRDFQLALVNLQIKASAIYTIITVVMVAGYSVGIPFMTAVFSTEIPFYFKNMFSIVSLIAIVVAILMTVSVGYFHFRKYPQMIQALYDKYIEQKRDT